MWMRTCAWRGKLIKRNVVGYDCDGLCYDGTCFNEEHTYRGQRQINHHIKLANDGFLYKTVGEMKEQLVEGPITRHRSSFWHCLCNVDIEECLGSILTYADNFFETDYRFTLFYNQVEERIDFVAYIPTDKLVITFEPGYPGDDYGELWGRRKVHRPV